MAGVAWQCQGPLRSASLDRFHHKIRDGAGNSHPRCVSSNQATLCLWSIGTWRLGSHSFPTLRRWGVYGTSHGCTGTQLQDKVTNEIRYSRITSTRTKHKAEIIKKFDWLLSSKPIRCKGLSANTKRTSVKPPALMLEHMFFFLWAQKSILLVQ